MLKVEKSCVIGGKDPRRRQAILFGGVFAEQGDVVEQAALVAAMAAEYVRLGQQSEVIAASRLADLDAQPLRIVTVEEKIRRLMMANQRRYLFAHYERYVQAPEDLPGEDGAASRVAARVDTAIRLGARAVGLGHVMEQRGGEHDASLLIRQISPRRQARQCFTDHARVNPHVALGMMNGMLRASGQIANPRITAIQFIPCDTPIGRLRTGRQAIAHETPPNRSTPSWSWLGTMGRLSQWPPESSTEAKKLARMYL